MRPHYRNSEFACNKCQNQNINVGFSELPIGPVQSEMFCSLLIKQTHDETGNSRLIEMNLFKEVLQTAIL